jgi:hypothetical protein
MKMFKRNLAIVLALVFGLMVSVCGMSALAEQTYPLKIWLQNTNRSMQTYCIVDEDTDVNYIVVVSGGNYPSCAICERVNPDGSPYVSK